MTSDPQKGGVEPSKTPFEHQKVGSRTPKIMTTGRWICRKCLNRVPPEAMVCRVCGGESFTMEWNPTALSEAYRREQEREQQRENRA
jgi:hypothetical protein